MTFDQSLLATCALLLLQLAWDQRRLAAACRKAPPVTPHLPTPLPSVSMVRPTKGGDVEQLENFRAALITDYPGPVEAIFVFEDADDPAHRQAEQAIAERQAAGAHGSARIVLAGPPPQGRTGKISNMIAGTAVATGDFIGYGDSDSRPDPALLAQLVADLAADSDAGAIFVAPVATPTPRTPHDFYRLCCRGPG